MSLPPDAHSTYDAHDPVEDRPRAAKHALVRSVKRLIELTAHLDVEECTDLGPVDALTARRRGDATARLHDERRVGLGV